MGNSSGTKSTLRIALAVLLLAAAGLILWRAVLGRYLGPAPVVPSDLSQVDPMVVQAVETASDAVRQDKRDLDRRQRLCMTYQANGLLDSAQDCWLQVVSIDDGQARAWFFLAKTYERAGQMDQAVESVARAAELDPLYPALHWQMGLWLIDTGRLAEAQAAIETAVDLDPTHEAVWFALAQYQLARQEHEDAVATITDHGLVDGDNGAQARHLLAAAYRALGRGQEAESLVAGVRNRPPSFKDEWTAEMLGHRTGYSYLVSVSVRLAQTGQYGEALQVLERIQDVNPEDHRIPILQAQCFLGLGEPESSLEVLQQAMQRMPDNGLLYTNLSFAALAAAKTDESLVNQALEYAEKAVALTPESSQARLALAGTLLAAERYEESTSEFRRSFELDARNPLPTIRAGHALIDRQRLAEARELLELVLGSYPQRASVWAGLARIELDSGRPTEARTLLEKASAAAIQDAGDLTVLLRELDPVEPRE